MEKRKKLSRAVSGLLASFMMVTTMVCASAPIASAASADPQVQLYYAQNTYPYSKAQNHEYEGRIAVKKTDGQKNVVVHYTLDGVNWQDLSSNFEKVDPNDQQYEVWKFDLTIPKVPLTFSIRYDVNGQTYWDNNNGNNYHASAEEPVVLSKSTLKAGEFSQKNIIFLKNLGYDKNVTIHYTTNGWLSTQSVQSKYISTDGNNVEEWTIPSSIPYGQNVQYYVSYTVNGVTYFDNNFGANYIRLY